jgi:hypothetical protein
MIQLVKSSARLTTTSGPGDARCAGPVSAAEADPLAQLRRRRDLEAFAILLDEVYHLPCSLVWHSYDAHQHRLHFWTPSDGWQCEVGTTADLAHRLYALGVSQRAAQRQQHRSGRPGNTPG